MDNMPVRPMIPQSPQPTVRPIKKFDIKSNAMLIAGVFLVVALGVGSGYLLARQGVLGGSTSTKSESTGKVESMTEAGIDDESQFPDTAEGTLEEGGIAGEGTHHLVRTGGSSQTVYLTSTVINMDNFAGKKVKVWGQTVSAKKAGWLMDVGKIKVTE